MVNNARHSDVLYAASLCKRYQCTPRYTVVALNTLKNQEEDLEMRRIKRRIFPEGK